MTDQPEVNRTCRTRSGLVEYALIIFLVAVVVIGTLVVLGPQINNVFTKITAAM